MIKGPKVVCGCARRVIANICSYLPKLGGLPWREEIRFLLGDPKCQIKDSSVEDTSIYISTHGNLSTVRFDHQLTWTTAGGSKCADPGGS